MANVSTERQQPGVPGRRCGDCQLCCKLLPMPPLYKAANTRCRYQRVGLGCTIYYRRPVACRTFACRWLAEPDTASLPRPDRAHYVIDPTWDYVTWRGPDYPTGMQINVMQVWVDPAHPTAWQAPSLTRYIEQVAEQHQAATLVRFNSHDALCVFAPCLSEDHAWHIIRDGMTEPDHRLAASAGGRLPAQA